MNAEVNVKSDTLEEDVSDTIVTWKAYVAQRYQKYMDKAEVCPCPEILNP